MVSYYKAACEAIIRKEYETSSSAQAKNFCCLCFDFIPPDADFTRVDDEVVFESSYGPCNEQMSKILLSLCNDFSDNMFVVTFFKMVCHSCSKSAISSYKFMRKCKDNAEQFANAVENITDCFENVADNILNFETLYASINTTDLAIEQIYDNRRQTKETALPRFVYLAHGRRIKTKLKRQDILEIEEIDEIQKPRERDASTIFIKTQELMLDPKSKEYTCKLCSKNYPASGSLRLHFFSVHFKKDYQCRTCPKSFGTAGLLHTHEKESHSTVKCNECGKELLNRTSTIKRHLLTHKTKKKTCERCGRSYKKINDFKKHIAQETCEQPSRLPGDYYCNDCGKHCHYKHQLTAHIRYEHGNATGCICKWCGRKCYNPSALKIHILKHTGEKNFVCCECGGKFVTRQSLINHMRLHTGERPYPCEHCEQSFLSASRRKEHIERHHTEATFECDLCDAKYTARRSLIKHKKRHFDLES